MIKEKTIITRKPLDELDILLKRLHGKITMAMDDRMGCTVEASFHITPDGTIGAASADVRNMNLRQKRG